MPDGNGKLKPATVVISVMSSLIVLGIIAVFGMAMTTGGAQTDHEASAEPHPIIQNKVTDVAKKVEAIDGKVDGLLLMQREQTVILQRIGEDIGELKEAVP